VFFLDRLPSYTTRPYLLPYLPAARSTRAVMSNNGEAAVFFLRSVRMVTRGNPVEEGAMR